MQELIDVLKACGYDPPTLELDGNIKRFPRNGGTDNGWLIGWRNHSIKTGKPYIVAQFGDWKTGETHTHKPSGTISREDADVIKRQLAMAATKHAEAKKERQAQAAVKSDAVWKASQDVFESPYLARKLIDKAHGTRTFMGEGGRVVVVPMKDAEGNLWNIQRIFADGTKKFQFGGRVEGTFHLIGEPVADELLVCEGFATGTSLHQATGLPVAVAFNAGNLIHVAKALRKAFPEVAMTICGDDDKWKPEAGNVGREKAAKAGMLAQAGTVFPTFASVETKPTDFNDLHALEGLDAVKSHFVQPAARECGFIPLGVDGLTHFYYSIELKDIVPVTTYSEVAFLTLAPSDYWHETYPAKTGVDWHAAKNELIQACKRIGPFDTGRIRGTGVWLDDRRIVVNTGHSLRVNGKPMPLQGIRSWFVYVQTKKRMPPLRTDPLTVKECAVLVDACGMLHWTAKESSYYLPGWLALARVAGALPVRPHIWLTGSSATGKSTVLDRIVAPALGGPAGRLYVQGGSTEAGIRQELRSSSIPVLFDEFETTGQATSERIASFVELLRQTWSPTQGVVLKGSATGAAVHYQLSFSALVSSIRVNLTNDADRSRFCVLELAPHGSNTEEWERLETVLDMLDDEYGERLFARICSMLDTIIESQHVIVSMLVKLGDTGQRMAQQIGTLLAGYWALLSDDVITRDVAAAMVRELNLTEAKKDAKMTDDLECLNHLLTSRIQIRTVVGMEMKPVGRVIAEGNPSDQDALKNYGVIVTTQGIIVANRHAELSRIFAGTRWSDKWRAAFLRIPKAVIHDRAQYGSIQSRSVLIPFDAVPDTHGKPSVGP